MNWSTSVKANHNNCTTLHAHSENEETRFYKKQGHGTHNQSKHWEGGFNFTHLFFPTNLQKWWEWWNLNGSKPTISQCIVDVNKDNVIKYCGTWYGTNHEGFQAMFMDPTYLQVDYRTLDDEKNQEFKVKELGVDICGFMTMNVRTPPI